MADKFEQSFNKNQSTHSNDELLVRISHTHNRSPFIVHLNPPSFNEEVIDYHNVSINLLVPEEYLFSPPIQPNDHQDLSLTDEDIRNQISEDIFVEALSTFSNISTQTSEFQKNIIPSVKVQVQNYQPKLVKERFSGKIEAPIAPPDYLTYFDLPEEDELASNSQKIEDDPDLIVFEEIEIETKTVPVQSLKQKITWPNWLGHLPHGWQRAIGVFILISFGFVLPLHAMNMVGDLRDAKSNIEQAGDNALSSLKAGANAAAEQNASGAAANFSAATQSFSEANQALNELGAGISLILSATNTGSAAQNLTKAGKELSLAGERLAEGFIISTKELEPTPTSRLALIREYVLSALPHMRSASELMLKVDPTAIPNNNQETLKIVQEQLPQLVANLEEFERFSEMGLEILGDRGRKRYLLVFQNNTELRATGGFMGSFAEIDVENGKITRMNVPGGGTYDLQGQLNKFYVAPEPLRLLKARWEFQDANWSPDFPSSARQILSFYNSAGGPTVDGVLAVNASYVAELLELIGPVEMNDYGRTIDSANFLLETQKIVELEYDTKENKPKAFIGDLLAKLLERASDGDIDLFLAMLDKANLGLIERNVQLYFSDEELERRIIDLGWGGKLKWTDSDYLMIIDSNLGGGKTDGVIQENTHIKVKIDDDGTVTNTVTFKRTHFGITSALFSGVNNVDYLRLYVPKGSKLISASGFNIPDDSLFENPEPDWIIHNDLLHSMETEQTDLESQTKIWEESGKTVFGNWVQTKPGTTSQISFTYRLPFKLKTSDTELNLFHKLKTLFGSPQTDSYSLLIQKQSGVTDRTTTVNIDLPENLKNIWSSHSLEKTSFDNRQDNFIATLLELQL